MKKQKTTEEFIGSFAYDNRLAPYDIQGSIAHALMLGKRHIIPANSVKKIVRGLESILEDLKKGWKLPFEEDIHFAIERELIRRTGDHGKMLHTGRSRNDQVITDVLLYVKDQFRLIIREIVLLEKALIEISESHRDVVMPGFTHLQHAQPVLFAHHMLAYAWMLERDKGRFKDALKRADVMPLGSAALAGTSFPIDRAMTAKLLGFSAISENSIDATGSRDVIVELVAASSILMSNLSRLAEELIIWSSSEFSFIQLATEFTSGSSIMPQKRNPDVAEIIRGETGRVYGDLIALLTILKGLPLSYNRDLQEDKPPLFDAADTLMGCLSVMAPMIRTMKVNTASLKRWCDVGFLAATELADYLAEKGVPFRAAHGVVREVVRYCKEKGVRFDQLSISELRQFHKKFDTNALELLTPEKVVRAKTSYGGTSPASVRRQIEKLKKFLR